MKLSALVAIFFALLCWSNAAADQRFHIDPIVYQQTLSVYYTRPSHKAMVVGIYVGRPDPKAGIFTSYGSPTQAIAIQIARDKCKAWSIFLTIPDRCLVSVIDDHVILDYSHFQHLDRNPLENEVPYTAQGLNAMWELAKAGLIGMSYRDLKLCAHGDTVRELTIDQNRGQLTYTASASEAFSFGQTKSACTVSLTITSGRVSNVSAAFRDENNLVTGSQECYAALWRCLGSDAEYLRAE